VRSGIVIITILCACTFNVFAQQARESFGKNRIQYRQFNWQYLSGENFDIYYYDNQKEMAYEALHFLEHEFDRITDLIDYPPYFKTKVFLYRSLADLRQSNVGLNHTVFNVGGETEFIKPYVEVANPGTVDEFKDELLSEISALMVNEMMFGGNLKDVFQSSLLMNLPDWFVDGAALYVAKGWNTEMDDYIRQFMATNRSKKITKLSGREAALAGQSVWNFIAEKYGKSSVSNILNYTRVTRNEEKSVLITLGVPFKQLMAEWQRFYTDMTNNVKKSYVSAPDSLKYTRQRNKTTVYSTVKLSPDGRYIAFAENDRGNYVVKVRAIDQRERAAVEKASVNADGTSNYIPQTTSRARQRNIISGGTKVINQRVDYRLPIISWADANTLGVIGLKQGQYVFWLYDLSTKSKTQRELDKFSNVRSINFSNNGRLAIISADYEGRNDLFLLSTRKDKLRRLTNDLYDDLDPSFIPNSNKIVFSSNRTTDSVRTKLKPEFELMSKTFNLFMYDLDSVGSDLHRITNTLSKDFSPLAVDENVFYYLSDQRGIVNLFKFNRVTGIYTQVTNFSSSIIDYDLNINNGVLALVSANKLRQNIYVIPNFNVNRQVFTPATRRKELQQARTVLEKRKQTESKSMSIKDLLNSRLKQAQTQDSTEASIDSLHNANANQIKTDTINVAKKPNEVVNTDNYQFEEEPIKQNQTSDSFISRYMRARDKSKITGPFNYESKFSANSMVTTLVFDQLRGLGLLLETQMNDMLENYRFYGGLMSAIDLKRGSDVYAEFQYLPRLIDFNARFERKAIRWTTQPLNDSDSLRQFHYSLNKFEVGASLPLTDRFRFTFKPFAVYTRTVDNGRIDLPDPTFTEPVNRYYVGFKSELVYDNSISSGLNLIEGTRGKITFAHYQGIPDDKLSFSQASIDLRHYQKIYREIVFAVRGFAGTFFGNSPKTYLLGGMDNWLFNVSRTGGTTSKGEPNPLGVQKAYQDLLFVEYVTSLRGFRYATIFGNNALLFNAELRVPLIKALSNAPISSPFVKNLQFIAFYDMGTSWSGSPPFSSDNSVSYSVVKVTPFEAKVKNYLNPWLYSYGVGMRTVLFGYYVKFDLAWPVENYQVGKPKPFITLGFDF
jgi:Tol biopolymer transport system component